MLGELGLENKRCIAFTGAGGKTTAVYTCVREMREEGLPAAAVTTTKMWKPQKDFFCGVMTSPQRKSKNGLDYTG